MWCHCDARIEFHRNVVPLWHHITVKFNSGMQILSVSLASFPGLHCTVMWCHCDARMLISVMVSAGIGNEDEGICSLAWLDPARNGQTKKLRGEIPRPLWGVQKQDLFTPRVSWCNDVCACEPWLFCEEIWTAMYALGVMHVFPIPRIC